MTFQSDGSGVFIHVLSDELRLSAASGLSREPAASMRPLLTDPRLAAELPPLGLVAEAWLVRHRIACTIPPLPKHIGPSDPALPELLRQLRSLSTMDGLAHPAALDGLLAAVEAEARLDFAADDAESKTLDRFVADQIYQMSGRVAEPGYWWDTDDDLAWRLWHRVVDGTGYAAWRIREELGEVRRRELYNRIIVRMGYKPGFRNIIGETRMFGEVEQTE